MADDTTHQLTALVCTGNAHKVAELQALLTDWTLTRLPDGFILPEETGATLLENARIKARAGRDIVADDTWVIADDSGLCVEALHGAPGVHSARFAGPDADDAANVAQLLNELQDASNREAHFCCVLVALAPDGDELIATGRVDGTIISTPRGAAGFGYDPVFVPRGHDRTFAELGQTVKDSMSHRSRAVSALTMQVDVMLETSHFSTNM